MKSFKSKKTKVLITCLAVILIASILCVSLVACKNNPVAATPNGVFFLNDMQKNIDAAQLAKITAEGQHIYSIQEMLNETGLSLNDESKTKELAAKIYALAATNYGNITQSVYYIMTNANVLARDVLAGNDVNVDVRSTYSSVTGKNGNFSQTVSGVTKLEGLGEIGSIKEKFGYNIQSFSNSDFSVGRQGSNGGAKFATSDNLQENLKWIMGAYNKSLTNAKPKSITANDKATAEEPLPKYVQTATEYPAGTTLAGKKLPSFDENRKPWDPLNRIPARYWEDGKIVESTVTDAGTTYSIGSYGASWAVYDMSRVDYLDDGTTITYDKKNDLYTIEMAVKKEYVAQACEFATGDLIRDTKTYISLKNAQFTEISCKLEVYGNGLIKSMQKRDGLETTEPSKLLGNIGTCKKGGATSNTAMMAFSYTDADCDALKYASLYWAELGTDKFFQDIKDQSGSKRPEFKLDLGSYPTIDNYSPKLNETLFTIFKDIFAETTGSGETSEESK